MKSLFFVLLTCASFLIAPKAIGQNFTAIDLVSGSAVNDTLTNAATLTFTATEVFKRIGTLHFGIEWDSLSGSTAATVYYEVALVQNPTADQWITLSSDVINGVTGNAEYQVTDLAAVLARQRVVGTGTQSTEVTPTLAFKPRG